MILFDYVYYIFANLLKQVKSERQFDRWRYSAIALAGGSFSFFIHTIAIILVYNLSKNYNLIGYIGIGGLFTLIIFIILFSIRYRRINYEKIESKLKGLTKESTLILNILTAVYLLIAFPGFLITVVYFGITSPLSDFK